TRTKTGRMKPFSIGGIATLIKKNPEALIVPIAINGSYKMVQWGMFPLRPFTAMKWEVLEPLATQGASIEEIVAMAEQAILKKVVEEHSHRNETTVACHQRA